ncbi:hypothetical protein [Roseibium album]|uniref:hypothetical protein n=1 Tax=Roseibium album TaxID=311410 RepID=UPI002490F653|nr:hypothetical protein [Roseibium album]
MITCLDIDKPFIRRDNSQGHGTVRKIRPAASMAMAGHGLFLTIECCIERGSAPTPMSLIKANDDGLCDADVAVYNRLNNRPFQHRPELVCGLPERIINDAGAFAHTRSGPENGPAADLSFAALMPKQVFRNTIAPCLETAG